MSKVEVIGPSWSFDVRQALAYATQSYEHDEHKIKNVIVAGEYDDGELFITSSKMDRSTALWLSEKLRNYAMNG